MRSFQSSLFLQNYGVLFTSQIASALGAGWGLQKLLASQGYMPHTLAVMEDQR
jgi:hypothetical protein